MWKLVAGAVIVAALLITVGFIGFVIGSTTTPLNDANAAAPVTADAPGVIAHG